jgi:hypothetical protein
MQATDFERFEAIMLGMGEMYGKDVSSVLLDAYWIALRSWDLKDFEAACGHLMEHAKFMPRPAEFTALRKAGRPTAAEAWIKARQSLVWGLHGYTERAGADPLISRALRAIGGANVLAMTDEDKLPFLERRFIEHYESMSDATDTRESVPQIAYRDPPPAIAGTRKLLGVA